MYLELFEPDVHNQMEMSEKATTIVKYEYYREYFNIHLQLFFWPATYRYMLHLIKSESSVVTKCEIEQEVTLHHRIAEAFFESLR